MSVVTRVSHQTLSPLRERLAAKKTCQTNIAGAVRKFRREEKIKCDRRVQDAACNKYKTKPPVIKPPITKLGGGYNHMQASIRLVRFTGVENPGSARRL